MGKIILLDELTANKIAAGEVIERPASVVKELVENSIDAGSTQIHIEVMNGGINKIKITDNGIGMDKEDAVNAFQRHATSKLRDANDLFNINTLGFRGEALPSVASVSKVVLITKEAEDLEGIKVQINGGKKLKTSSIGTKTGTSIDVTELFYNTPARKKYLKTETTEFGHISDIITRLAMGNPHISFVLNHNGRQVFRTPGTNKLIDVVSTIYGIDIAKKLLLVKNENEYLTFHGLIGKPEVNRANRQQQSFFINGRYIKSKIISYSLEEGFRTLITTGRYPFAILNLTIDPEMIDVNVHPTKMEVRFSQEKEIIRFITQTIQEALGKQNLIPGYNTDTTFNKKKNTIPKYSQDEIFSHNLFTKKNHDTPEDSEDKTRIYEEKSKVTYHLENFAKKEADSCIDQEILKEDILKEDIRENSSEYSSIENSNNIDNSNDILVSKEIHDSHERDISYHDKSSSGDKLPFLQAVAQIDKTYIVAQGTRGMFIIDQHAAHERVLYEKFLFQDKKREGIIQSLLIPITLNLTPNETQVLINNIIIFHELGFLIEHFGGNTFLIRAVPQELSSGGEEMFFKDLLDSCLEEQYIEKDKLREKIIITMACKGAIKANQVLSIKEMDELIKLLDKTRIPFTCPHGRPTIVHFSQYDLEKKFKRVQ